MKKKNNLKRFLSFFSLPEPMNFTQRKKRHLLNAKLSMSYTLGGFNFRDIK